MNKYLISILTIASASITMTASANPDGQQLFNSKCAMCHSIDQKKMGPSVKSMSTDAAALRTSVAKGKGMMPAFEKKLNAAEIDVLVDYMIANQ